MLKTQIPENISSIEEAEKFLAELISNDEAYHPEDDANDCLNDITKEEGDKLNKLMEQIYAFPGNENVQSMIFDPCEFILNKTMPFVS